MPWVLWGLTLAGLGAAWLSFHSWRPPNFILIPIEANLPLAPVYSFLMPQAGGLVLLPLAVLGGAAWGYRRLPLDDTRRLLLILLLLTFAFRLSVHLGRTGTLPGNELGIPHDEEVIYDVPRIESAAAFLHDYTRLQPELTLHGRTKPPGFALLLYGMIRIVGSEWTVLGTILTLAGCGIVIPTFFLRSSPGRESREAALAAALTVGVLPSAALFGAITLDAVFAVVAATAMALAVRASGRPAAVKCVLLGLTLFVAMMLSYSAFLVLGFVGVVLIAGGFREPRVLAAQGSTVLAAFLVPFVLLYLGTGFDALECFQNARSLNIGAMRYMTGRDIGTASVWLYTSVGNILAFLLFLGVPVVAGLLRYRWQDRCRGELPMALALGATLAVASAGGLYLLETERILMYLAAPAAALAARSGWFPPAPALLAVGLQTILTEALLFTIW